MESKTNPSSSSIDPQTMHPTRALPGDRRPFHEQPPTPIVTGKGLRSAAVNDEVLSEYLETSLNVPNLTLPRDNFPSSSLIPIKIGAEIDLSALAAGDAASLRSIVAAATESGEFWIEGGSVVSSEEVNAAVQAGEAVFDSEAARRRGLVTRFGVGGGGGIGAEICWYRSNRKEMEPILEDVPVDTYRAFRERMEVMAAKLEIVADCISYILWEHVGHGNHRQRPPKMQSILCLRKHLPNHFKEFAGKQSPERNANPRCLSIHLPIPSASFSENSILVTIGEQMQEWCNGEYRTSVGGMKFESDSLISMEFIMFYLKEPSQAPGMRMKTVSVSTQLLVLIMIAVLLKMFVFS